MLKREEKLKSKERKPMKGIERPWIEFGEKSTHERTLNTEEKLAKLEEASIKQGREDLFKVLKEPSSSSESSDD